MATTAAEALSKRSGVRGCAPLCSILNGQWKVPQLKKNPLEALSQTSLGVYPFSGSKFHQAYSQDHPSQNIWLIQVIKTVKIIPEEDEMSAT